MLNSKNKSLINLSHLKELAFSLFLILPIILFYFAQYNPPKNYIGTGFVQGDMLSYMANARQHFDDGSFHFLYANPFNLNNSGPHIYFQIQTLFLGALWHFTHTDVGIIFMSFGLLSSFLAIYVALQLYKSYVGWGTNGHRATFILFIYGGGILVIGGFIYNYFQGYHFMDSILKSHIFDPGGGYWMLNFGRNFIYSTEAYYHLLTISIAYLILKNKQLAASIILFILAFSHPFYGIQFLLIILIYQFSELYIFNKLKIKKRFVLFNLFILVLFGGYNGIYLSHFEEHKIIIEQWSINWFMDAITIFLAYLPILIFALISLRHSGFQLFKNSFNRFLLIYFLISLALANHELIMKPIQPIHFAHGHIYIPLFLLGSRYLISFFNKQKGIPFLLIKYSVFLILISDNLAWFSGQSYINLYREDAGVSIRIKQKQIDILNYINSSYNNNYLLISENNELDYFATAYTSVYALDPHLFNTPYIKHRKQIYDDFYTNKNYTVLNNHKVLFIDNIETNSINTDIIKSKYFTEVYRNKQYILYERKTFPLSKAKI